VFFFESVQVLFNTLALKLSLSLYNPQ